ncbi:MAG TPA: VCBS repeat-containing protein [Verrucomicrobiota bacterium]|nr:VCBS repeat-containing protein [Verrucomicrobiota bacterium]HQL78158.1 VCBS repeat-containing protein [Verrucomicrobiota bacterium]
MKTITRRRRGLDRAVIWAAGLALAANCLAAAASRFGFTGREIFPIENQISQLHVADLDGDGLNDVIVVNNARSKLNLLYNETGKTNLAEKPRPAGKRELNELPPDARFRIESIASEKRIAALAAADLNSDGRPDLAYYGEPRELIVLHNEGTNNWSVPKRWPIEDGQLTQNALATGDLNGDSRTDVALLSENCVYVLSQKEDHTLGEPQKIPVSGTVKSIQVVDVDGDGLSDLLLVDWEDRNPFRFRRQKPDGALGPEIYFATAPIRSYWADNLVARSKTQVITIAQYSGRAKISEFTRKPAGALAGSFRQGQFQVWPLTRTDKSRRGLLWADVSGDGLSDLLVAEPESGQVSLALQQPDGSLPAPTTFPTLAGISDLAVADGSGEGKPEIFMLSADERQVGVARLDEAQRLPFPTLIPLEGRPLALAVGKLRGGTQSVLAVLVEPDAKGGQEARRLLVTRTADGKTRSQNLSKDFKANPTTLAFHDADQDGLADLVALMPYEKVKILRQVAGQDFEELDVAPPGGARDLAQPWLGTADIDGDGRLELLLAQKNFLRAVVLEREAPPAASTNLSAWTFAVKEQINGAGSNSRLAGAAAVPNGTNAVASLFLLDAERKALTLCERDHGGAWQVVRNVPLPVSEFTRLQPLAVGAGKTNAVALLGLNTVACLPLDGQVWELTELDSYETPIKDGYLTDVVSGDLDSDGRKDLVFLETARNYLDLVLFDAEHKLVPANRWQVFEERTFRGRRSDFREPREAVVADVTGDARNDLIIIVHDRVIVYPQE